jgi:putative ABC transport system permease protein
MRRLRSIAVRLARLLGGAGREREWKAEFESHLEMHIEDKMRAGVSAEEARRQVLVDFGGIESTKDAMRDQAGFVWLNSTVRDVGYTFRGLRRSPAFTLTAILSLTLSLGAGLAVFTVADNLLVRPLPYHKASRLIMIWENRGGDGHNVVSPANYLDWKSQNDVFEDIAALSPARSAILTENGRAEEFLGQSVTANFFALLGVHPVRGRVFTGKEDRTPGQVALISYRLWQSWFGGDENIIGRNIEVNSLPITIVGVLPPDFYFLNRETDLWGPLGLDPAQDYRKTQGRWLISLGRLSPGVTVREAQAHMSAVARRLEQAYPAFNTNWRVNLEPMRDALFRDTKTPLLVLLAAVIMLLTVGCANLANLLLARHSARRREIAVRASLGAGRWRVIRQLLTESLILGLAGGVCGLMLARSAVAVLLALAPHDIAQSTEIHVDFRIVLLAIALSLLTAMLFGIAPALAATRIDLVSAMRGDSRSGLGAGGRLRSWLVGVEVTMSVVLLTGAILLFRSLVDLETVNPGLDASNLLTFRVPLAAGRYREPRARTAFFQRALDQFLHLPGVRSASAVSFLPFTGPGAGTSVNIEGGLPAQPGAELEAVIQIVMPGYFRTLGIPFKSGRDFIASDNLPDSPYRFVVNEAFVRQFLRGEQPLGKRINAIMDRQNPYGEIVGVVADTRELSIDHKPEPTVYYPHIHLSYPRMVFLVRVDRNPLALAGAARRTIRNLDPEQPIAELRTLEDVLGENFSRQRFSAWLLAGFAMVSLMLAAVGIYGMLAYSVSARTREFGVRAAVGAEPKRIIALVLKGGFCPVVGGVVMGGAGALIVSGLLKSLLFGVGPRDPLTFVAVPLLLSIIGVGSAWLPARRAARLDPLEALRTE